MQLFISKDIPTWGGGVAACDLCGEIAATISVAFQLEVFRKNQNNGIW